MNMTSTTSLENSLSQEIAQLKQEKRAMVLAHNYQVNTVKQVADVLGDSYALAAAAQKVDCDWIVFAGVRFMAETAKLLNPTRRVILPERKAGCDLADSITVDGLKAMKKKHPGATVVMYINSSVEIKAESDIICTSGNALKVIEAAESDSIIFGPDKNLASFVAGKTKKTIIPWNGWCPVHEQMTPDILEEAITQHPEAEVVVHPECERQVQEMADAVLSTAQMLEHCQRSDSSTFIIGTEIGLIEQLQHQMPNKHFYPIYRHKSCDEACACPHMKITKAESILKALQSGEEDIQIDPALADKALQAVQRMLDIGR